MKKRLLALLLSCSMVISMLPTMVLASNENPSNSITLPLGDGEDSSDGISIMSLMSSDSMISTMSLVGSTGTTEYSSVYDSYYSCYGFTFTDSSAIDTTSYSNGVFLVYEQHSSTNVASVSDVSAYNSSSALTTFKISSCSINPTELGVGTYTFKYESGGNSFTCDQTLVVVDGLYIDYAYIENLYVGCTEFDIHLQMYGFSNESQLDNLSFQMTDGSGNVVAKSDGSYKDFYINSSSGYASFYARMVVEEGSTIAQSTSYSTTITYDGNLDIYSGVSSISGSVYSVPTPEITDFIVTDSSISEVTIKTDKTLSNVKYTIQVCECYSTSNVYGTVTSTPDDDGNFYLTLTKDGESVAMEDLADDFRVYIDTEEDFSSMYNYYDFENVYCDVDYNIYMSPYYISSTATSLNFTVTADVATGYDEDSVITMVVGSTTYTATITDVNYNNNQIKLTGTFSGLSGLTASKYYDVFIDGDDVELGVYCTASLEVSNLYLPTCDYNDTLYSNLDKVVVVMSAVNAGTTATLGFYGTYDSSTRTFSNWIASSAAVTGQDGVFLFEISTDNDIWDTIETKSFYLVLESNDMTDGDSYYNLTMDLTAGSYTSEYLFFLDSYTFEEGVSTLPAELYDYNLENFSQESLTSALLEDVTIYKNYYSSSGTVTYDKIIEIKGFENIGYDEYYNFTFDVVLEEKLEAGSYRIQFPDSGYYSTFTVTGDGETADFYLDTYSDAGGGYIYGSDLPTTSSYTAKIYKGYTEVTESFDLTLSNGCLYYSLSILDALDFGNYTMRIYMDGDIIGEAPLTVADYNQPTMTIWTKDPNTTNWSSYDGYVVYGTASIVVDNKADYSYMRMTTVSEDDLANQSWQSISVGSMKSVTLQEGDGLQTIYIEFATDSSGSDSRVYEKKVWVDADGDYDLVVPEEVSGFYYDAETNNYGQATATITVTASLPYAQGWIRFYDADGDYATTEMDYIGINDDEEYEYSISFAIEDSFYDWYYNASYYSYADTVQIAIFMTDLDNWNYDELEDGDSELRSEFVVRDIVFGDPTYIMLPQFNSTATLYTNEDSFTLTGYATPNSTVTVYSDNSYTTTLGSGKAGVNGAFSIQLTDLDEDSYALYVKDSSALVSTSDATLIVDITAPTISDMSFSYTTGSTDTAYLQWSCTDSDVDYFAIYKIAGGTGTETLVTKYSGNSYQYTVVTSEAAGDTFKIVAVDYAGNEGELSKNTADSEDPVITKYSYAEAATVKGTIYPSVEATDNIAVSSGTLEYSTDGESYTLVSTVDAVFADESYTVSFTWDTTAVDSGGYTLRFTVYDGRGNSASVTTATVTIDNDPPDAAEDFSVTGSNRFIHVDWTASEEADVTYTVYRSTSATGTFTAIYTGTDVGYYDNGTTVDEETDYYYYVTVSDTLGNKSEPTEIFSGQLIGDEESPVIVSFSLESSDTVKYKETLSVTATDNYRLSKAVFYYKLTSAEEWTELATVEASANSDSETFTYVWDLSEVTEGSYDVKVEVYDTSVDYATDEYPANDAATKTVTGVSVVAYVAPIAPVLAVTAGEFKEATFTWAYTDTEDTSFFSLYSCDADGENLSSVAGMVSTSRTKTLTGLTESGYYVLRVYDSYGRYADSDVVYAEPVTADTVAPVAVITASNVTAMDEALDFSAVNSTDNDAIVSWNWSFGDGATSTEMMPSHTYTTEGTYTVTLTVVDAAGNTGSTTLSVTVVNLTVDDDHVLATFTVVDSSQESTPVVPGASVTITSANLSESDEGYFEVIATADSNGQVVTVLEKAQVNISVAATGFTSRSYTASLLGEESTFEKTLGITSGSVIAGELTSTDMTLDEIKAAGIDITDESNQQVVKWSVTFEFIGVDISMDVYINGEGEIVAYEGGEYGDGEVTIIPVSEYFYLVIYGETHWLKEMYNVELLVLNGDYLDDFTDVVATLTLPDGLSLATLTDSVQTEAIDLGTIEANSSASAVWYVRGDDEGEYNVTASLEGMLGTTPVYQEYTTEDPVKVYAGSALSLTVEADSVAYRGKDYVVEFTLENVSEKSLYNLSFMLTGSETYRVTTVNGDATKDDYTSETLDEISTIEELEPGATLSLTYVANDLFTNVALGITYAEYHLTDVFATTLSGSTTSIPITFIINGVTTSTFVDTTSITPMTMSALESTTELTIADMAETEESELGLYAGKTYYYTPVEDDSATVTFGDNIAVYVNDTKKTSGFTMDAASALYVEAIGVGDATMTITYDGGRTYTADYTITEVAITVGGITLNDISSIAVPLATEEDTTATVTYSLVDLYGNAISSSYAGLSWTIEGAPAGITVDNGVITVDQTVAADTYTVTASADEVTVSKPFTVTREDSVATTVEILRGDVVRTEDTLVIPVDASTVDYTYTAKVYDQYGIEMADQTPEWRNGTISLTSETELTPVTVTATVDSATTSITVTITNIQVEWSDVDTAVSAASYTYGDTNGKATLPTSGTATVDGNTLNGTFSYDDGEVIQDAGTATITVNFTVTDEGTYEGLVIGSEYTITIEAKALTSDLLVVSGDYTYDGTAQTPTYEVTGLTVTTDFTVSVTDNTDAGEATITITGCNNYSGAISDTFTIAPKALSAEMLAITGNYTYDGTAQTPTYTMADGTAMASTDYTTVVTNNTDAGEATLTITGTANYTGEISDTFTIAPKTLTAEMLTITGTYTYTGSAQTPDYAVADGDAMISDDYTVAIIDNVNAGTATVTVTGGNNYTGTISNTFIIAKASLEAIDDVSKTLLYSVVNSDVAADITSLLPVDYGTATLSIGAITGDSSIIASTATTETGITFTTNIGNADDTATIPVTVSTTNYADVTVDVVVTLLDKTVVTISGITVEDKVYDGTGTSYSGTAVGDNDYTGEFDYSWSSDSTDVGRYVLTVSVPAEDESFMGEATYVVNITPKELTIAPANQSIYNGAALPTTFTLSYTGLVSGDSVDINGDAIYTIVDSEGAVLADSSVNGTYDIQLSGVTFSNSNYTITTGDGTLTISTQSITGGTSGSSGSSSSSTTDTTTDTTTETSDDGAVTTTVETETTTENGVTSATVADEVVAEAIETAIAEADGETAYVAIAVESGDDATVVEITLTTDAVSAIADSEVEALVITSDLAVVEIPSDALAEIAAQATGSDIVVVVDQIDIEVLTEEQAAVVGDDALVVDLGVLSDGVAISSFGGYTVTVSIPYELKEGELAENIVVWYIADDGTVTAMDTTYDEAAMATFKTTHFSVYAIVHDTNAFIDVTVNDWFYDAVLWAVDVEITTGVTSSTFEPTTTCSRAAAVTFLYRLAGEPEVEGASAFVDVADNAWYTNAVLWAVANGITNGTGDDAFSPDATCTRAEIVTFLYRYAGQPEVDGTSTFADVSDDAWYANAVIWAVENAITNGTGDDTFSPDATCTRGEIVTFLYRYMAD